MASQKYSNFSIDYILGDKTAAKSPAVDHASSPQEFPAQMAKLEHLYQDGSRGHPGHPGMMNFPETSWTGMYSCCAPVTYYQTSFNYYTGQQWPLTSPGCDKTENHQHQTGPQRRCRVRTVFTDSQTKELERLFAITDYPTAETRAELAKSTGLSEETVRVWFKNRRARRKRLNTCPDSGKRAPDLLQESD